MAKTKRSKLIAKCKMLDASFIKKEYGGATQRLISTSFGLDLYEQRGGLKGLSYLILLNAFQIVSI